jgi:ABC-type sulfate/molybdate transport systems ATPase subunit
MLERVRLRDFADQYPTRLSGGQRQRVAIARAPVTRPSLLLMDEPLANLDESLREEITQLLLSLHGDLGFTLVYVTHNRSEIESMATRSVLLDPLVNADSWGTA